MMKALMVLLVLMMVVMTAGSAHSFKGCQDLVGNCNALNNLFEMVVFVNTLGNEENALGFSERTLQNAVIAGFQLKLPNLKILLKRKNKTPPGFMIGLTVDRTVASLSVEVRYYADEYLGFSWIPEATPRLIPVLIWQDGYSLSGPSVLHKDRIFKQLQRIITDFAIDWYKANPVKPKEPKKPISGKKKS